MAQIEQVDITPGRSFEMIPKIGNQLIVFGSADNYEEKFNNLLIFYKNVQSKIGWNKYSTLNVSYKNQVIAVKRDAQEIKMDSLRAIQVMKLLVANAQRQANDSSSNIQLVQPKDDNSIPFAHPQDGKLSGSETITNLNDSAAKQDPVVSAPVIMKSQFPNNKTNSNEKPNPIFIKKPITKPIIKKPVDVPNKQPKAVMQPKNDY
jgi:cell division protein FtsQ